MFYWTDFQAIDTQQYHKFECGNDDEHTIKFVANDEVFKESVIDDEEHQADLQNKDMFK